ncbi:GTPase obg [Mesomycoplasma conjunctivae]|uniref:GTPase Obg n=1 Tax=Mesomycoplasma conjunctivae (strain ATCC 25834 / NCTC 10147 / HRC/581) TaxID=572263 RepID=C5J789_MESCH|nr:GTPase ObgE [Mesomycoplasma conjunctivae]CAT05352.1 GTP-binding protein [Mesomycoplasma conjunctivae]VEU66579.1 GTPase obg [Mesomycoplasma conjunctivae]
MKFLDQVKIQVEAGKGGNGVISFRREAHVDKGGPDGGDGGSGGSIYFVGDSGLNTLLNFYSLKIIKGNDGENGRSKNRYGAGGSDIFVKVPIGTQVYVENKLMCDVVTTKPYLIAKGGKGGRGNTKFKTAKNKAPRISENGDLGEFYELQLVLKVMADVGLVGKPNAGKSTLLSQISNAKPKIANYSFTTLVPQLGLVKLYDKSFVIADLPGLIEGASQGKGLGFTFLKHIERCRVIAHIIDFGSKEKNPIIDYENICKELNNFNPALSNLPQIIIANKSDLSEFSKNVLSFKKKFPHLEIVEASLLTDSKINEIKAKMYSLLEKNILNTVEQVEESVVEFTLQKPFIINKKSDNLYEVEGLEIKKLVQKIPLNSDDNILRFNNKLKNMGIWDELIKMGIKKGDVVKFFNFELEWI